MTGEKDGIIKIWKKESGSSSQDSNQIQLEGYSTVKSFNCGGLKPLIQTVNQDIVVASQGGKLLVLDTALNVKNEYKKIYGQPYSLAATEAYIAIGTNGGEVIFYQRSGSIEPTVRRKSR